MTENKRFVNKGKDIFQYGEWWCSAGGEHCADVIATALNEQQEIIRDMKLFISNLESQRDEFHRGARENARIVGKLEARVLELEKEVKALSNGEADWISEEYL